MDDGNSSSEGVASGKVQDSSGKYRTFRYLARGKECSEKSFKKAGNMIDIANLDKASVLMALYENAHVQGLGFLHASDEPMSRDAALKLLERRTYFDYVQGRVMKVNLTGDAFDPFLYDRDNGQGAAQRAIDTIRVKNL